jgi:enoyl-[acyl-carrier-protein] reductase (NADH)
VDELDEMYRFSTWKKNTESLRKKIKKRFSSHYQKQLLPFLRDSDNLRVQRNENIHALWQVMGDANIRDEWGRLDFLLHSIAYAPKEDLHSRITDCS